MNLHDRSEDYLIVTDEHPDVFASDPAKVPSGAPYTRNIAHAERFHDLKSAERALAPSEHVIPIDDLGVMFGGWMGGAHV